MVGKALLASILICFGVFATSDKAFAGEDQCPSIDQAASKVKFETEQIEDFIWRIDGPNGPFYVEAEPVFCLFTMSANMSSYFSNLSEAGDIWAKFRIKYGTFYERNGKIYLEQVAVIGHGSTKTLSETLRFFDATAFLVTREHDLKNGALEDNSI